MASSILIAVADLDEQVDDRHVREVADIRDFDFNEISWSLSLRRSCGACRPAVRRHRALKRVASAPSMTRSSAVSDSGRVRRGTNCLPSHTGFMADL